MSIRRKKKPAEKLNAFERDLANRRRSERQAEIDSETAERVPFFQTVQPENEIDVARAVIQRERQPLIKMMSAAELERM